MSSLLHLPHAVPPDSSGVVIESVASRRSAHPFNDKLVFFHTPFAG